MVIVVIVVAMVIVVIVVIVVAMVIVVVIIDYPSVPELIPRDISVVICVEMLHEGLRSHSDAIFLELLNKLHESHKFRHVQQLVSVRV